MTIAPTFSLRNFKGKIAASDLKLAKALNVIESRNYRVGRFSRLRAVNVTLKAACSSIPLLFETAARREI